MNIPVEREAAIVLGAPVGRNVQRIKQMLMDAVNQHDRFFQLLLHEQMPMQEANLILTSSGVPRMGYLIRCMRPSWILEAAEAFDAKISSTFIKKVELPSNLPDLAIEQISWPVSKGGWSLRRSAALRHFAYVSSVALAAPMINKNYLPLSVPFAAEIAVSRTRAACAIQSKDLVLLPKPGDEFIQYFTTNAAHAVNLQNALTASYESKHIAWRLQQPDVSELAESRIKTMSATWAGGWVNAIPYEWALRLHNFAYKIASYIRLGVLNFGFVDTPGICGCGEPLAGLHWLSCVKFGGQMITRRHNDIVKVIVRHLRMIHAPTVFELAHRDLKEPRKAFIPDIETIIQGDRYFLDPTVRNPLLPSNGGDVEACDLKACDDKIKRYRDLANGKKGYIVPWFLSPFGSWGHAATEFVKLICKANDPEMTGVSTDELRYSLCAGVAVALQRGNARAYTACVTAGLAAEAGPVFYVNVPDNQRPISYDVDADD